MSIQPTPSRPTADQGPGERRSQQLIAEARDSALYNEADLRGLVRSLASALEAAHALATPPVAGDEHHSIDELYEYRMLYNAHAAHGWLAAGLPVVKSWQHSDGELCFGGGWFIVTATLPTGQVSNHYAAEHWGLFRVPPVALPPVYDGHTPAVAAERLRSAISAQSVAGQPRGEALALAEMIGNHVAAEYDGDPALDGLILRLRAARPGSEPEPREVETPRTFEELMGDDRIRYTARRDSDGGIRLSGGHGALVATASDTRADVQEWFDRAGGPKWAAQYKAALNLMDSELTLTPSAEGTP